MKYLIILVLITITWANTYQLQAQKPILVPPPPPPLNESKAPEIFMITEELATPKGGIQNFYQYIQDNLRYPAQAKRLGVEGRVFVQFVINEDGSFSQIEIKKGIGAGCDEEAVRLIKAALKWKPAKNRGKIVRSRRMVPIIFRKITRQAQPQGGYAALYAFVEKNLKYPQEAQQRKIQGTVKLACTIEANGQLGTVKVVQSLGDAYDQEAIRLIKAYPAWKTKKVYSEPVKGEYIASAYFYKK